MPKNLCNPGNIKKNKESLKFQGVSKEQPHKRFLKFNDEVWGLRALARILVTYKDKYKINTLEKAISRYAPPEENPTEKYIEFVSDKSGFPRNQELDFHLYEHTVPIIKAMVRFEQGEQPCTDVQYDLAANRAGLVSPPKPPAQSKTAWGGRLTIGGVSVMGIWETFKDQIMFLLNVPALAKILPYIVLGVILVGGIMVLYAWWDDRRRGVR